LPETTFQDTGLGDETFPYEFTLGAPLCQDCRFKFNLRVVAPCCDCAGHHETQRSYFQELYWG